MLSCLPTCYMWRSKDDFQDSALSFQHLGSRYWTQVSYLATSTPPAISSDFNFLFLFFMPLELVTSLLLQPYMSRDCRCEPWCLFQSPPPLLSIKKAGELCLKPHKWQGTRMSFSEPTESLEVILTSESETINACCFKPTTLCDTVIYQLMINMRCVPTRWAQSTALTMEAHLKLFLLQKDKRGRQITN